MSLINTHSMKHSINLAVLLVFLFCAGHAAVAQTEKPKLYDPNQDVKKDIKNAVAQAKSEGKHVLLQVGGNW